MTKIVNDPERFPADSLAGFTDVFSDYVQAVHGGVVRTTTSPGSEVALVVGGGSGHYPAFAGWVGPGMAHGAVCGNIFSSPSASQAESVITAADNGAGAILMFGNYAGDVIHFGAAAKQLRADGHDVRIVTISDDVASGDPAHADQRRGIGGDFPIVKITGAACADGLSLDQVEQVARRANARTRSLGVAFTGCTLPGADEPLFTVADGTYAVGLGIHGEPGIATHRQGDADQLAHLLVGKVMAEEPDRGADGYQGRVAVLVNGLGATKYEELFLLYGRVAALLRDRGLQLVHPVVDEQVTSLDMAGCSLTVTFLDDQLERYWTADCDTPAYRYGAARAGGGHRVVHQRVTDRIPAGFPESARQGERIAPILDVMAEAARKAEHELGRLDAVAGDGDHGEAIVLGTEAAAASAHQSVQAHAGAATLLERAGAAWSEGAGGTSGALWGAALSGIGQHLSNDTAADQATIVDAVTAGLASIPGTGGAELGDKTMVDATVPFADDLADQAAARPLADAWAHAARVADRAAQQTAQLTARKGRARIHGDASLGTPDPGAVSFALLVSAIGNAITSPTGQARLNNA